MLPLIKASEDGITINNIKLRSIMDVRAYIQTIYQASNLSITLGGHKPKDLNIDLRTFQTSYDNMIVKVKGWLHSIIDLPVELHGFDYKNLPIKLGGHFPVSLRLLMKTWHERFLVATIGGLPPADLIAFIRGEPHGGTNLRAWLSIISHRDFNISFLVWTRIKDLFINFTSYHYLNFATYLNPHGGYKNLTIPLDMKTGWVNMYVSLRVNIRRISTIIPVSMMLQKDLYVILNKWLPCGFNSAYRNLNVLMIATLDNTLRIFLRGIKGSGSHSFKVYINKEDFPQYIDKHTFSFSVAKPKEIFYDYKRFYFDSSFKKFYLDYKRIRFKHPRKIINGGVTEFPVYLNPYEDKTRTLSISLKPYYEFPAILKADKEIQLWTEDPPELFRIIELYFEQQVQEYIWSSADQMAYKRELWEKWCLMTKTYKPSMIASGFIDYASFKSLCSIRDFESIDEGVRYLIDKSVIIKPKDFRVYLGISSAYKNFNVYLKTYDQTEDLLIYIGPVRERDLTIELIGW